MSAPSRYRFAEYSREWPAEFEREAARLRAMLGDELLAVHHVGSTSVPGLAAKPIVDLIPLVRDLGRIDALRSEIEEEGYKWWGEYHVPGRRFLTKDREGVRTHNVHLFEEGAKEVGRHLAFCAWLREHREACREYEALKRKAYVNHPVDVEAYNDAKNDWIKEKEVVALEWWQRVARPSRSEPD